jgi:hypothetical protein
VLPNKRRRAEVSFPCNGSDSIGIRILHVRAPLALRVPLILKVKVMEVPSILQGVALKRLFAGRSRRRCRGDDRRLQLGRMDARKSGSDRAEEQ